MIVASQGACYSYEGAQNVRSKIDNAILPQSERMTTLHCRLSRARTLGEKKRKKCEQSCNEKCILDCINGVNGAAPNPSSFLGNHDILFFGQ